MGNIGLKIFTILLLVGALVLGLARQGFAQRAGVEELFVDLGPVSYSSNYILAPDSSHITFHVKNQTTRTIENMYGWVYVFVGGTELKPKKMTLVNNPHRGGTITDGNPHRPGEIADWRFPLIRTLPSTDANEKFTLRVSFKGIFFPKTEPPPKIPSGQQ